MADGNGVCRIERGKSSILWEVSYSDFGIRAEEFSQQCRSTNTSNVEAKGACKPQPGFTWTLLVLNFKSHDGSKGSDFQERAAITSGQLPRSERLHSSLAVNVP